jgi:hypothetical protein
MALDTSTETFLRSHSLHRRSIATSLHQRRCSCLTALSMLVSSLEGMNPENAKFTVAPPTCI